MICAAPYGTMTENTSAGVWQNCWSIPVTQWSLLQVLSFVDFKSFYYLVNVVFSSKKVAIAHSGDFIASFYSTQTCKVALWTPLMDILSMKTNTSSHNSKGQTTVIVKRTVEWAVEMWKASRIVIGCTRYLTPTPETAGCILLPLNYVSVLL